MRFGAGGGGMSAFDALRFVSAVELGLDMMWSGWGWSCRARGSFLVGGGGGANNDEVWMPLSGGGQVSVSVVHPRGLVKERWRKATFVHDDVLASAESIHRLQPYQRLRVKVPA